LLKEIEPAISQIRPIIGDQYFPVQDADEFAHKAGLVLITLIIRRYTGVSVDTPLDEKGLAEVEAFKQKLAERKGI
jgi:hypothetical protein